jgi:hypothetical protein
MVNSTSYEAPRCAILSNVLPFNPSLVKDHNEEKSKKHALKITRNYRQGVSL